MTERPNVAVTPAQQAEARRLVVEMGLAMAEATEDPLAKPAALTATIEAINWAHEDPAHATALVYASGALAMLHVLVTTKAIPGLDLAPVMREWADNV